MNSWMSLKFGQIRPHSADSFLGYSSFSQVKRQCIKAWMNSDFSQIPPLTAELSTLERLKK